MLRPQHEFGIVLNKKWKHSVLSEDDTTTTVTRDGRLSADPTSSRTNAFPKLPVIM